MLPDWTLAPVMATTTDQGLVNRSPMVPCPVTGGFPGHGGDQCISGGGRRRKSCRLRETVPARP
jgi:hypothetical protein